ncbi:MAG: hypothetical protein ACLR0N_10655 [Bilophila wadsworthia]
MRTLLANATVITMNPTRDVLDTDILIENGVIADMGPGLAGRPENAGAERVDLSGRIVIPGLIQSHMHVTQSLFRGWPTKWNSWTGSSAASGPRRRAHARNQRGGRPPRRRRSGCAAGSRPSSTWARPIVRTPFSKPCATWGCAGCSASACSIWAA